MNRISDQEIFLDWYCLICSLVIQMMVGLEEVMFPMKFHLVKLVLEPLISCFLFVREVFLKLCWIIHQVIRILLLDGMSLSFPVTLSSAFWRTEQESKMMISAFFSVSL